MKVTMSEAQARFLARWLNDKYELWRAARRREGKRHSMVAFAEYLGVKQSTLSEHMSLDASRAPRLDIPGWLLYRLYKRLGADIMDAFGADVDDQVQKGAGNGA